MEPVGDGFDTRRRRKHDRFIRQLDAIVMRTSSTS